MPATRPEGRADTPPPRRFVVYGAGAVGGVVGGRLFEHGHDVVLVARGAHYEVLRDRGLRLESPQDSAVLSIPVVEHPGALAWRGDDVVLLTVKSQDTAAALSALGDAGIPDHTPVVCLQNGVDNERVASRWFAEVYAVCVMLPAQHLEPGVVQASSAPVTGILDVGRYPSGTDGGAALIAEAFAASTFVSEPRPDIMKWKYCKLVMNLANAVEALFEPSEASGEIARLVRREGVACLRAAGIDFVSKEDDAARRGDLIRVLPVAGQPRGGGSTWQSLARGTGTAETAFLNGEIVLLGRLHGIDTPVNARLLHDALDAARARRLPGTASPEEFLAALS